MLKLKAEDNLKHVPCRKVALADSDPENIKPMVSQDNDLLYIYIYI